MRPSCRTQRTDTTGRRDGAPSLQANGLGDGVMNQITDVAALPVEVRLSSYDHILVAFSGGKDSLACVLHLLDLGVPKEKIELHHHDIDGREASFMDWPCTPAYCRAVAAHFGIPIYFSWREGGFLAEMLKENARSKPVIFEQPDGSIGQAGGIRGNIDTRRKFPQVSPNLSVRWCSRFLKIEVLNAAICNQRRFDGKRLLVITGERGQESKNRLRYKTFEPNRADAIKRPVDHWRPIHKWMEADVWEIIRRYGIVPHPAYQLGWGRLSCRTCIFGSPNQWATIRAVYPAIFERIAGYETEFGVTIKRNKRTVRQQADRGTPYAAALAQADLAAVAQQDDWHGPVVTDSWEIPAGAFGENAGPV